MRLFPSLARLPLAAGLLVTLVACGGGTPGGDLYVTDPVLLSRYVDNQGNPLICDNLNTPMEFDFLYGGDLRSVQVSLVGVTTGERQGLNVTSTNFSGGHAAVTFTLPTGTAPLNLPAPQAIIPVPVPRPSVIGYSKLEMRAFSGTGETQVLTSNAVPVVDNCG